MKIVLVTGSNKGIGRGIVETLYKTLNKDEWSIYMTARNEELGRKTLEELKQNGVNARFHQLDIDDDESRKNIREYLKQEHGGLDVLVNNAGIAYKNDSTAPFAEQAEVTLKTNFYSTLKMCLEFLPIMKENGRIVNVSSMVSTWTLKKIREDLYKKFTSPMKMDELVNLMDQFVKCAKEDTVEANGWSKTAYGTSKLGCTKMTMILADDCKNDPRKLSINCCCPGYVDTDMTSHKGHKTVEQGADTPCYLVTMPINSDTPNGFFWSDRTVQDWK